MKRKINTHLDPFYATQCVYNECVEQTSSAADYKYTCHRLAQPNIVPVTVVGTIYVGEQAVQTFSINECNKLAFNDVGESFVKVLSGTINSYGELCLDWNHLPEQCRVVANYEYTMESECDVPLSSYDPLSRNEKCDSALVPDYWTTKDGRKVKKPTFKKFFSHAEILDMVQHAATHCCWDFNSALGDTIREKYESLYVKTVELSETMLRKGAAGLFWIVTSPEVASIFETATYGFNPTPSDEWSDDSYHLGQRAKGVQGISCRGIVMSQLRLYVDLDMESDLVLMGVNDTREANEHYGVMRIANFII